MFITLGQLRIQITQRLITGLHLGLLLLLLVLQDTLLRMILLAMIGVLSGIAWLAAHRRYQAITYTPTSRIRTAAQGYVELFGRADVHPGSQAIGFRSGPPSVWYRYRVQRISSSGGFEHISSGCSEDSFILVDDTGSCVIDPVNAEVIAAHARSWVNDDYRISVEYLAPGDLLYAIGNLGTVNQAHNKVDRRVEISALLREWKKDQQDFLARFDTNSDGKIDPLEWERARATAKQTVDHQLRTEAKAPELHCLAQPAAANKPFLLSNQNPDKLAKLYQRWSWFHVTVFVVAILSSLALSG